MRRIDVMLSVSLDGYFEGPDCELTGTWSTTSCIWRDKPSPPH